MKHCMIVLMLLVALTDFALAQPKTKKRRQSPAPTAANFRYGEDSERQVLDFWKADSEKPTPLVLMIHGGGWVGGDKNGYRDSVRRYLRKGISVAAINYRYIPDAHSKNVEPPVKAPLHDAARALQTIRANAKEWNIDPKRIGATGGSAGACTSLWLAFHDDLADADSDDPIKRESTRLQCAAVIGAQTSLDPVEVRSWIPNAVYGGHAFGFITEKNDRPKSFELAIKNRDKIQRWIDEYSPILLVTKDDPPIYLDYPNQKSPPKQGQVEPDPTHSAMYGVKLAEKLRDTGVEVVLAYPGNEDKKYGSPEEFLIEQLTAE